MFNVQKMFWVRNPLSEHDVKRGWIESGTRESQQSQRSMRALVVLTVSCRGFSLSPAELPFGESRMPATTTLWPLLTPVLLLMASNIFMTVAWYGHLTFKSSPLWVVVLVSWAIAFVEYCLAVPANRFGHGTYSAAELKTIQEVITLVVFVAFSALVLKEPLGWNHALGFTLIAAGAACIFAGRS
jgi:uncharacterized protein